MSVETSDAVKSTVPPELAIPHVSACLVTLRVPDPVSVSFRTADLVFLGWENFHSCDEHVSPYV